MNPVHKKFDEKFETMVERVQKVEKQIEDNVAKAIEKQIKRVKIDIDFLKKMKVIPKHYSEESKLQPSPLRLSIKLSSYDGKISWKVYEMQLTIVVDAKGWDSKTKALHLDAFLPADTADVLQTLPEKKRLDFQALTSALKLLFGEKFVKDYSRLQLKSRQQKSTETFQDLATDNERLSHFAFLDSPVEIRENMVLQHFINGVRDSAIQKALRMANMQDIKGALVYAMKYKAACKRHEKMDTE